MGSPHGSGNREHEDSTSMEREEIYRMMQDLENVADFVKYDARML